MEKTRVSPTHTHIHSQLLTYLPSSTSRDDQRRSRRWGSLYMMPDPLDSHMDVRSCRFCRGNIHCLPFPMHINISHQKEKFNPVSLPLFPRFLRRFVFYCFRAFRFVPRFPNSKEEAEVGIVFRCLAVVVVMGCLLSHWDDCLSLGDDAKSRPPKKERR